MSDSTSPIDPRRGLPAAVGALVCVHAAMAATRVTASLLVLHLGYPEWTVGALLSLFAVAPIGLSLWAGRLADRHGLHRPLAVGVAMGALGSLVAVMSQHPAALALAAPPAARWPWRPWASSARPA